MTELETIDYNTAGLSERGIIYQVSRQQTLIVACRQVK